jgi:hypothetical protein
MEAGRRFPRRAGGFLRSALATARGDVAHAIYCLAPAFTRSSIFAKWCFKWTT